MAYSYPLMQVYGVEIPTRCFIGGLPYSMTELEFNSFFSQFGIVHDCKIITDRNGISKGYGFITYSTEQEAADVCARGTLYYKEKKLNISKAIRRQGGQYSKANQEYVNGQRMLYQSSDGYLLGQAKNGSWLMEEPSPYCQPAKPCFQIVSPPPVFVGGPNTPYIQSPVTPSFYHTLPSPHPTSIPTSYETLPPPPPPPPPPDPGPLLYCNVIETHQMMQPPSLTSSPVTPSFYHTLPSPHPTSIPTSYETLPPPPPPPPDPGPLLYCNVIETHQMMQPPSLTSIPDITATSPQPSQATNSYQAEQQNENKEGKRKEDEKENQEEDDDDELSKISSLPSTATISTESEISLSLDMNKCSLTPPTTDNHHDPEVSEQQMRSSNSYQRRPSNLMYLQPQTTVPVYPQQNYYVTYQCTS